MKIFFIIGFIYVPKVKGQLFDFFFPRAHIFYIVHLYFGLSIYLGVFKAPSCTFSLEWNVSFSLFHFINWSIQIQKKPLLRIAGLDTDMKSVAFSISPTSVM